jgi:hypothetical protein
MDARIKSGHDGRVCCSIQFSNSQDVSVVEPSLRARPRHSGMVRRTRPGISRFRVRCGACHRAALRADPLASPRNDGVCSNSKHGFAFPRREAPELLIYLSPQRGRGECRMPNAPAVSCAMIVIEGTRATTSTPESPGIPARNGFNGFLRALPGDRACLPPSPANQHCIRAR